MIEEERTREMLEQERVVEGAALSGRATGRLTNPYVRDEFGIETMDLNIGPQHPAMHGLLRLVMELDGETVVRCDPVMGYLHRCQEKIAENRMWPAVIPLTDRLDYFANMHMEHGYCLAVEDLLELEIPPRADAIRVLMCELMRLASHLPSIGFLMLELGAFTPSLYSFRERERIQDIFEAVTGARMMYNYIRIGGVKADLPKGIPDRIWSFIENLEPNFDRDFVDLIEGNEIFVARTRNVGKMTQEKALEIGLTGPPLRCTGVDFDIRRDYPYSWYPNVDFDVITDTEGDAEASYRVRVGEVRQSIRIVKQILGNLPEGAVMGDVPRRIRPPEGEGFGRVESPRGEYAVHVVSDGSDMPYRVHYRDPSFVNMQLLQEILPGHYLPDLMPIMGIVDPVSGGWDK
ncbi:NADH dehydrogenase (quinone) subunit D [soil metagenome]